MTEHVRLVVTAEMDGSAAELASHLVRVALDAGATSAEARIERVDDATRFAQSRAPAQDESPATDEPARRGRLVVTAQEAAEMLTISRDAFDEHVKPDLPPLRIGRRVLFRVADLERWIETQAS